ncbi:MAG: TonB-dependent receptor plug domain-containing protein [Bacteroidota bacterium]
MKYSNGIAIGYKRYWCMLTLMFLGTFGLPAQEIYREKVFVHLDKTYYRAGETIWFKAYVVDADNLQPDMLEMGVLYVDLLSSQGVVVQQRVVPTEKGLGYGEMPIGIQLPEGVYTLRAYTSYMRNFETTDFFREELYIANTTDALVAKSRRKRTKTLDYPRDSNMLERPRLAFSPEAGQLINGVVSKVAFTVTNPNGKGIEATGNLLDESGAHVVSFNTRKKGIGVFSFIPQFGKSYRAQLFLERDTLSYDFPKVEQTGIHFSLNPHNDVFHIVIISKLSSGLTGFSLVGNCQGIICYKAHVKGSQGTAVFKVPYSQLPEGPIRFTLKNANGTILGERRVLHSGMQKNNLEIVPIPLNLTVNNPVKLRIQPFFSLAERMDKASLSLSIVERAVSPKPENQTDIRSHFWLEPQTRALLGSSGYAFTREDLKKYETTDLAMISSKAENPIPLDSLSDQSTSYLKENGITVSGQVRSAGRHSKPVKTMVVLGRYFDGSPKVVSIKESDEQGYFRFTDLDLEQGEPIVVKVNDLNAKQKDYQIILDTLQRMGPEPVEKTHLRYVGSFVRDSVAKEMSDIRFYKGLDRLIRLEEVVVRKTKKVEVDLREVEIAEKRNDHAIYRRASNTVDFSKIQHTGFINALEALRMVAGVQVRTGQFGGAIGTQVFIRQATTLQGPVEAFILLDGMPTDADVISSIAIQDIDFIDVLKGPAAAIYGLRAYGGVVAVYTKDGSESWDRPDPRKDNFQFKHWGYHPVRDFNAMKEDKETSLDTYSSTVGWKPHIEWEKKPVDILCKIDRPGTYVAVVQGISTSGQPLFGEYTFKVH